MKLFSLSSIFVSSAIALFASCCSGPESRSAFAREAKADTTTIERDYLVQGMTCGGCVFGVKQALKRAGLSSDQILDVDYRKPDPEHKIGHAKVRIPKSQFQGEVTDCKIIREIHESPGYVAYLDPTNTDPCKLGKKE